MKVNTTWQSLRITQKIWCGLSILVIGYLASMAFGFVLGRYTESRLDAVEKSLFPAAMQSQQALSAFNNQSTQYTEAVIIGDPKQLEMAQQHGLEVTQALETIASLTGLSQDRREAAREILKQFQAFTTSAQTVYAAMSATSEDQDELAELAAQKQQAAELARQTGELREALETFKTLFAEMLKTEVAAIRIGSKRNRYQNVAVFVVVVSLATVLVNALITRGITRPIATIVEIAHAIAKGDVSQEVNFTGQDEIGALAEAFRHMKATIRAVLQETERLVLAIQAGQLGIRGQADVFSGGWRDLVHGVNGVIDAFVAPVNITAQVIDQIANGHLPEPIPATYQGEFNTITTKLNFMSSKLKDVVLQVKTAADLVAVSSSEVRQTAEQMAQGAEEQAAAAEEASSSMEQMSVNIRQNADNARQTEQIASQSKQSAEESGTVVAKSVVAMQQIARKITIIQDIADQTRMLSLNATIEAVRAQEYGKAFSVVASEVRKLSDITKTAADEINELAGSSLDISEKAGAMLETLVPNIQKTAGLVQEISAASYEQSTGTEHVNQAIQQLDHVTQQNALTAEQMATTAELLATQANQLQQTIAFFKINGDAQEVQVAQSHKTDITIGSGTPILKQNKQPGNGPLRLTGISPAGQVFDVKQHDLDGEFERY